MTRLTARAALCIAGVALSGCGIFGDDGYFRDRSNDYQQADSLPPLQMPEGVTPKQQEELYEVPQISSSGNGEPEEFEVPRPQALAVNVGLDRVKIQKLGDRRWVLVSQPPEEVWPQLHFFLRTSGLQLATSDATAGIMETTWLSFRDSPETKDKYRLRVESGVQPDTTEIHVRHLSLPREDPRTEVAWPARSSSPEREGWMIDEMSTALAAESSGAAASLVAQAIGGGSVKVQLREPANRDPFISLDLSMDRAWATVAHAVNSGAYRMHLEDDSRRLFYVTYDESRELTDEEEDGGWFSWGGSEKEDKRAEAASRVTLEQLLANLDPATDPALFGSMTGLGGATGAEIPGYIVVVRSTPDAVEVRVRDTSGKPLKRARAAEMLMAIRQNLI
ncbi:outer membrane protein assembly factor BamC [Microbulbifer yueqingensis]|uniref:Beta-barrel assembly machine subunit BamC n=1 Tax=Microbulbifer yueqingensis TaxID=658219 RepID=A0A1G8VQE8_9GAMM|nr:outer membrane protein assembly factor BamC [Microbulbifer yueqingensis]SDJ68338.1 Beta-barrel assembly machine subunit BamC [Microbulbifer yueqingensis]